MDSLGELIEALRCLPGVGPKSAQRMAYYLLQHSRQRGLHLADCLEQAMTNIRQCTHCNNYTETPLCALCQDASRDTHTLCVVESPSDLAAIEQTRSYKGRYFVLMGKISPLDGMGASEIGLPQLCLQAKTLNVTEIILALGASVEGQTTCHFIREMLQDTAINISQLAQGIPSCGELEYLDSNTISYALRNRANFYA